MLRIIAGKYKGIKIDYPDLEITRPTTDKVREAIFSSIQFEVQNSICLDLFSGSGAMAIEAVSRGATKVIATEKNRKVFQVLNKNIKKLNINNIEIFNTDAITFLEHKKNIEFDFIFLDPPYELFDILNQSLALIKAHKLLKKHGIIILETNDIDQIVLPKHFLIQKTKVYSKTKILFITQA
ncbi:16S rRNA (guanine(966)-N(2))-methyltransferase RsmD [Candidatus Mycoplasma pogonae]